MRSSIRVKLLMILTSIILLFGVIIQLFSFMFLEDFYLSSKKKTLKESFNQVEQILLKNQNDEDSLLALQDNKNVTLLILNSDYEPVFQVALFKQKTRNQFSSSNKPFNRDEELVKNNLDKFTGKPVIQTRTDLRTNTEFLSLYSTIKLSNSTHGFAIISTSVDAMKDSVKAASRFILYVSLFVGVIGTFVILYVSGSISKPIVKINKVTAEMAKLDFSKRINVQSTDEIGELANNINFLSEKLGKTLNQLAIANEQLKMDIKLKEKIDQSRKELISNVSHELKTPISLIGGYAEGLKLNVNKGDKDFYCEVIIDETQKMNKLVLGLLDLSQVEAGYKQLNKQRFNMTELVEWTIDKYKLIFIEKEIDLKFSNHGDFTVLASPERIEQVLTNYLNNALNHVDSRRKISVQVDEKNKQVRTSVFNSGKPIDPEQLGRIWESFYKVDKARTRDYGGTGLGLSIVKAIIKVHEGEYGVINHADGVEFWFTLNKI